MVEGGARSSIADVATSVGYVAAISLDAFLLFLLEPLFGKMVLPHVGGNAAVWTTCMLFFQVALVAGYLYAHALARVLRPRAQAAVHISLLIIALAMLPVRVPAAWAPSNLQHPEFPLLGLLLTRLGAPFLLLAAGSPLIQHWAATNGEKARRDPYSLYAASNVGSFAALLAYPILVEPRLGLRAQAAAWSLGYLLLIPLMVICAVSASRGVGVAKRGPVSATTLSWGQKTLWLILAAAPSSLLLGVTTHITTDLAPVPLLWVLPLALYLATFVIAFGRYSERITASLHRALPYLVLGIVSLLFLRAELPGPAGYAAHMVVFFACALGCHLRLAASRPHAAHLTEFYLWISIGGALGGVFNVLIAPNVFRTVAEYPIALVATAALARPGEIRTAWRDVLYPAGLGLLTAAAVAFFSRGVGSGSRIAPAVVLCVGALIAFTFREQPVRFALAAGAIIVAGNSVTDRGTRTELAARSFYGVYRVVVSDSARTRQFYSGTTVHGSEALDDPGTTPLTYYHRDGPLGTLFGQGRDRRALWRVGVIGLGVGSTAAYARAGEKWTYYEIDPLVARIAADRRYFRFLSASQARPRIVIGDARLSIAREPTSSLDLLLVDAFSSDAIPVHLITREALALYRARLNPGGIIAWHISNRFLDLRPVLLGLARDAHVAAFICDDTHLPAHVNGRFPSVWVFTGDSARVATAMGGDVRCSRLAVARPKLWTDDFSNVLGVLR